MLNKSHSISTVTKQNLEELNTLYLKCQSLIGEEDYEQVFNLLSTLQNVIEKIFEDESFKKMVFISQDTFYKEQQALLIAVNHFLNEEVKNIALTQNNIKSELASIKTANKMKKAYGG
jgi:hypothetical protein